MNHPVRRMAAALALLGLLGCGEKDEELDGQWTTTAALHTARVSGHAATLLPDGSVLVTGGVSKEYKLEQTLTNAVERYNPALDTWTDVAPMPEADADHSVVVLSDGSALLVGSRGDARYEPDADRWTPVSGRGGSRGCGAITLDDGGVLAVSLYGGEPVAHRFDVATMTWTALAPPLRFHEQCKLVRLASGEVMAVGGFADEDYTPALLVEIFSPATNTWRPSEPLPFVVKDAVALPGGDVLALGVPGNVARALRWSSSTDRWFDAPAPLANDISNVIFRRGGLVVLGEEVLALFPYGFMPLAQRYDPKSGSWTALHSGSASKFMATRLADGRVLATGCQTLVNCTTTAVLTP